MQRRLVPAPDAHQLSQEIGDLRRSHALLSRQVQKVASELRTSQVLLRSERISVLKQLEDQEEKAVFRTVNFLKLRAKKVLLSPSPELGRNLATLCASNSVVQSTIRSPASDCTLYEFQLLAAKLLRDDSIHCYGCPSEYHIQYSNTDSCSRLHIVFDSYSDICQALTLDAATRESGLYREKKSRSRNTVSAQVLGVELSSSTNRCILLACNVPAQTSSSIVTYLYQESPAWFEGSWERGFTVRSDPGSTIYSRFYQDGRPNLGSNRPSPDDTYVFSISWERIASDECRALSATNVAGALRTHFPAVIIRTHVLVSTARDVIQRQNLQQLLSVPQSSTSCHR